MPSSSPSAFRVTYCDCGLNTHSSKLALACEFCRCQCDSCGGGCLNNTNRSAYSETYHARTGGGMGGGMGGGSSGGARGAGYGVGGATGSVNLSWQDERQIAEERALSAGIRTGVVFFLRTLAFLLVAFATTELFRVTYAVALAAVALYVFDTASHWANTAYLASSV